VQSDVIIELRYGFWHRLNFSIVMDGMDIFSEVSLAMPQWTKSLNYANVKLFDSKNGPRPIFNIFTFVSCIFSLYNYNLLTVIKFLIGIGHLWLCCVHPFTLEMFTSWFEKKHDDTLRRLCHILSNFLHLSTVYHIFLLYNDVGLFH